LGTLFDKQPQLDPHCVCTLRKGKIIGISKCYAGKVHDKKIWDMWYESERNFLGERELVLGDKGYQGVPEIITPIKKKKGCSLSDDEYIRNQVIADVRVTVENILGRVKKFFIMSQPFRSKLGLHPLFFSVCCKLANIHIKFHPLRKNDSVFLR